MITIEDLTHTITRLPPVYGKNRAEALAKWKPLQADLEVKGIKAWLSAEYDDDRKKWSATISWNSFSEKGGV